MLTGLSAQIDRHDKPDDVNRESEESSPQDRSGSSSDSSDNSHSYYYDDSTGYEVYTDVDEADDDEDELRARRLS